MNSERIYTHCFAIVICQMKLHTSTVLALDFHCYRPKKFVNASPKTNSAWILAIILTQASAQLNHNKA